MPKEDVKESGFTAEEETELSTSQETGNEAPEQPEPQAPAASASEKPAPETKPNGKAPHAPPPGFVPQEALHEARREVRETKERMARMEALWQQLQQQRTQPQQQAPQIPDENEDPIGHLKALQRLTAQQLHQVNTERAQRQAQEEQHARTQDMLNRYASSVKQFAKDAPDFNEAYQHLVNARDRELEIAGWRDPVKRQERLEYEEGLIVGQALHSGDNPGQILYELAKNRGYKSPVAKEQENRLAQLQAGQKASKSLGGSKGSPEGVSSLEALSNLEGKEFDEAWAKLAAKGGLG